MKITNLTSLKKTFQKIKTPIFGAGVYAFERLGPEKFFPNYQLLSLYSSKETNLIKKDIPTFCLEEKINKKITPRNSSSLLSHFETQKYLKKFKNPLILPYKLSRKIERAALENYWQIAAAPYHFGKQFFEDKIKFREILHKIGVLPTPGKILSFSSFLNSSFLDLKKEFSLPFVIQHPRKGGGKGTFFIKNDYDLKIVKEVLQKFKTKKVIVAKFIKGPTPSITGCVTRFGILSTRLQYQICDIPELYQRPYCSGLFCGHDWSASYFSSKILSEAKKTVEKVGNYFKNQGYKGIFGLDFVLDQKNEKLYLTECNPRLLGSMPSLHMVQIENNEPPIIAFHLLEFLNISYEIDISKINEAMWQKKEGAQMLFHNPLMGEARQTGELEPGVYSLIQKSKIENQKVRNKEQRAKQNQNYQVQFINSGYELKHLQSRNEFLLTDGIQKKDSIIQPFQKLCRIITKDRVLDKNLKDLLPETKEFIRLISENFKLVPI